MKLEDITKEWLYEEYVVKNRKADDIAKQLGCCKQNISHLANTKYGFHKRFRVSNGMRFGKLQVLDYNYTKDKYGHPICLCKCDCNKICEVVRGSLITGNTRSCGCLRPNQSPYNKTIPKSMWKSLKYGAKVRNLEFSITIEYIESLFDGKCSLSGLDISFGVGYIETTASLDRIDSFKGYIPGNVQWVHKEVNFMKQSMSQEHFIELCRRIVDNAKKINTGGSKNQE